MNTIAHGNYYDKRMIIFFHKYFKPWLDIYLNNKKFSPCRSVSFFHHFSVDSVHENKWSKTPPSLYELEVVNYTGVPLPLEHDKVLFLHIRIISNASFRWSSANVKCTWKLFANTNNCTRHSSDTFLVRIPPGEIPQTHYGVHVLVVDILAGKERNITYILLHYEYVVHEKVCIRIDMSTYIQKKKKKMKNV